MKPTSLDELREMLMSPEKGPEIEALFYPEDMDKVKKVCDDLGFAVFSEYTSKVYNLTIAKIADKRYDGWEVRSFVAELAREREIRGLVERSRDGS